MIRSLLPLLLLASPACARVASFSVSAPTVVISTASAFIRDAQDPSNSVEEIVDAIPEAVANVAVGALAGTVTTRIELETDGSFVEIRSFGDVSGILTSWRSTAVMEVTVTADIDTRALYEFENGTDLPDQGATGSFFGGRSDDRSSVLPLIGGRTHTFSLSHSITPSKPYSSLSAFTRLTILPPLPDEILPGDFNANGVVDAADYTLWRDNFGRHEALLAGAGNGSDVIDTADYTLWRDHFGMTLADLATETPIPEPHAAAMLLAGLLVASRRR